MTAEQSDHDTTAEELEKLLNDEDFRRLSEPQSAVPSNIINESASSTFTTPDPLNTAFMNETVVDEQDSHISLSQPQSQTTYQASSAIHGLISTIIEREHEMIDSCSPTIPTMTSTDTMPKTPTMKSTGTMPKTPTMISTGTMPKTPTMKSTGTTPKTPTMISTGTMPKTPTMISTGTMPKTPTMISTGTMPKTPIATASTSVSMNETIDLRSSTPSTIDLVSPTAETIDVCSPDTPANAGSSN